jgi:predicted transcriptional regulator
MRSVSMSLRVPVDLHDQLTELAEAKKVGVRAVILEACRDKVKEARSTHKSSDVDELESIVELAFGDKK